MFLVRFLVGLVLGLVDFVIHNLLVLAIVIGLFIVCQTSEALRSFNTTLTGEVYEATGFSIIKLIGLTWLISVVVKNFDLWMVIAIFGILIMLASFGWIFAIPLALIATLIPACMLGPVLFTGLVLYYWFVC